MPYPAQLQGPALPKSVSCYVLLLFRVAIAQVFNICSTLKIQGNVQLSYYHAALVLSIKKARSSAVCFVIFVVELMLCRGSITARLHVFFSAAARGLAVPPVVFLFGTHDTLLCRELS